MEDKKSEQKVLQPISDEKLEQVNGGYGNGWGSKKCESRTTQTSCLERRECSWVTKDKKCVTSPLYG